MISPRQFESLGGETVWKGKLFEVRRERLRFVDGEEVTREFVHHGGAVGIVAHDERQVWLVRQPREAIGDPDMLEIPAGRRDVEGEEPLVTAQRELAEEIGRGADTWQPIMAYHSSVGSSDEKVELFVATDLREAEAESEENERIEIVAWPLDRLDEAIEATTDAKTIIALMWLRERLRQRRDQRSAHAHCPFEVTSSEPSAWGPADQDGPELGRATLHKRFAGGDVEGISTVEMLSARSGEETGTYVALERIEGTLAGRFGSFVLQHGASAFADDRPQTTWAEVVDGSGTGDLIGLRGRGRVEHGLLELDYELPG